LKMALVAAYFSWSTAYARASMTSRGFFKATQNEYGSVRPHFASSRARFVRQ
jgi:hypothetical protein